MRSGCRALLYWPHFRKIDFGGILTACDPGALRSLGARIPYGEGDEPGADSPTYGELAGLAPLEDDASRPDAPCIIFTTSGTTKAPKFVLHDQQTVLRPGKYQLRARGTDVLGLISPVATAKFKIVKG